MERRALLLASTSPYRRALLERLGIAFETAAPSFVEEDRPRGVVDASSALDLARRNAVGKARSLAERYPRHLILGSDQVCECDGRILGKAGSPERALDQLKFLAGREHRLHTAVVLFDPMEDGVDLEHVTTTVRMRALSEPRLRRYVAREVPIDTAGSYYSEGLGIALFDSLEGDDPTAIIGLPLLHVCRLLERAGRFPLDEVEA